MSIERNLWFADQFVLSAGVIMWRRSTNEVCVTRSNHNGEFLLPKGRKNAGECLADAAIREAYEETGHTCNLLPVRMLTRATPLGGDPSVHVADVPRKEDNCVEPFALQTRGNAQSNKLVYWFLAEMQENRPRMYGTQVGDENFDVQFVPASEAVKMLSFDDEKQLMTKALQILSDNFPEDCPSMSV